MSLLDVPVRYKMAVLAAAVLGGALAYGASYLMRPTYRAEVVVSPLSDSGGSDLMVALGSQLGGLGALAGLGGLGGDSERNERLAALTSRELAERFIQEEELLPKFCGALVVKCAPKPAESEAGTAERVAYDTRRLFQRRVLSVNEDRRSGLVRVAMTWIDRDQAADWANRFVNLANRELLARSLSESDRRIEFLQAEAAATEIVELRQAVYKLMESEIKSRMVASSRVDYAFKVIDPALVPDERDRVRPKRALMAVLGAALGALLVALVIVLRERRRARGPAGLEQAP